MVTTVRDTRVSDKPADIQTVVRAVSLTGTGTSGSLSGTGTSGLGGGFTATLGDTRAIGGGNAFQVAVAPRPAGGGEALVVFNPIADAAFAAGSRISVTVPADAFAHSQADAAVALQAAQANGAALPAWLSFNPKTGTFEGTPPPGFKGEVAVKVIARDNQGREAVQSFKIKVGTGVDTLAPGRSGEAPRPAGRSSLTQQLHDLGREGRVAKQAALFQLLKNGGGRAA